jgi:hypothetical protein
VGAVLFSLQPRAPAKAPVLITVTNFADRAPMELDAPTGFHTFRLTLPPRCAFPLSLAYKCSADGTDRSLTLLTALTGFIHRFDAPSVDASASMNEIQFFFCSYPEAVS